MAANTLVDTFKVLRDADDWMNSMQIALKCKRGERTCREAAKALVDVGAVRVNKVGTRQYFVMKPDRAEVYALPFVVDILETIIIKDKK